MFDQSGVEAVILPPAPPRLKVTAALPPPRIARAPALAESLHGPPCARPNASRVSAVRAPLPLSAFSADLSRPVATMVPTASAFAASPPSSGLPRDGIRAPAGGSTLSREVGSILSCEIGPASPFEAGALSNAFASPAAFASLAAVGVFPASPGRAGGSLAAARTPDGEAGAGESADAAADAHCALSQRPLAPPSAAAMTTAQMIVARSAPAPRRALTFPRSARRDDPCAPSTLYLLFQMFIAFDRRCRRRVPRAASLLSTREPNKKRGVAFSNVNDRCRP